MSSLRGSKLDKVTPRNPEKLNNGIPTFSTELTRKNPKKMGNSTYAKFWVCKVIRARPRRPWGTRGEAGGRFLCVAAPPTKVVLSSAELHKLHTIKGGGYIGVKSPI